MKEINTSIINADLSISFQFPVSKHFINYKNNTRKDENDVTSTISNREPMGIPQELSEYQLGNTSSIRLERQVINIGGNTDKLFISEYLKKCSGKDRRALRKHIDENTPDVDTTNMVKCEYCKFEFNL